MAMEKLHEIYNEDDYDLIVLDTPPTRRALDFLEAPARLTDLLGHNILFKFFRPYLYAGRFGFRLFTIFASPIIKSLSQVMEGRTGAGGRRAIFQSLGRHALRRLSKKGAGSQKAAGESPETVFFAVASPMARPLKEAFYLYEKLAENHIAFGGFVVNRAHPEYAFDDSEEGSETAKPLFEATGFDTALSEKIAKNFEQFDRLAKKRCFCHRWFETKGGSRRCHSSNTLVRRRHLRYSWAIADSRTPAIGGLRQTVQGFSYRFGQFPDHQWFSNVGFDSQFLRAGPRTSFR